MSLSDITIDSTVSGFFDQAFVLFVNNQVVEAPLETYGDTNAPTPVDYAVFDTTANKTYDGIRVNWLHLLFGKSFMRVIYTFTNTGNTATTFNADIQTNLATNAKTRGKRNVLLRPLFLFLVLLVLALVLS